MNMKFGQLVIWTGQRHGLSHRYTGIALDVIVAGDRLSDSQVVKERGPCVSPQGDVSIYDRVLVEVNGGYGRREYRVPRLAMVKGIA